MPAPYLLFTGEGIRTVVCSSPTRFFDIGCLQVKPLGFIEPRGAFTASSPVRVACRVVSTSDGEFRLGVAMGFFSNRGFTGKLSQVVAACVVMLVVPALRCAEAQTSSLPVFPGAVGFGTTTVAGSGRGTSPAKTTVFKVTNLNDSGTGSLRACLIASGPRTCVFEVAGYINLLTKITVKNPNVSVFGQTAPYPGVQVRDGSIVIQADDVLIQHIASRPEIGRASCRERV